MTPAALATARRLVAAPWWTHNLDGALYAVAGVTFRRAPDGARWVDVAFSGAFAWLPDLDDAGTAGRIVADLQATGRVLQLAWVPVTVTGDAGRWQVIAYEDHAGGACAVEYAPTLGHAVALALLAVHEQEK